MRIFLLIGVLLISNGQSKLNVESKKCDGKPCLRFAGLFPGLIDGRPKGNFRETNIICLNNQDEENKYLTYSHQTKLSRHKSFVFTYGSPANQHQVKLTAEQLKEGLSAGNIGWIDWDRPMSCTTLRPNCADELKGASSDSNDFVIESNFVIHKACGLYIWEYNTHLKKEYWVPYYLKGKAYENQRWEFQEVPPKAYLHRLTDKQMKRDLKRHTLSKAQFALMITKKHIGVATEHSTIIALGTGGETPKQEGSARVSSLNDMMEYYSADDDQYYYENLDQMSRLLRLMRYVQFKNKND